MRLLVADDNAQWRDVIARLTEAHHELVGVVERGDQILEVAERLRPEVITLDVRMPGESGLNALPRLRRLLPKAIIIIVSATSPPFYKEEAFARGADGYINKSKLLSELLPMILSVRNGRMGGEQHLY
jgi:CheY-like chemotaxis protein